MVSPGRYLAHYAEEAKNIENLLYPFGHSGEVLGFWCKIAPYAHITDCIKCPQDNFCSKHGPPLERQYNPDEDNWRRFSGDHMLLMLHEGRGEDDYLWLQHPETRNRRLPLTVISKSKRM